MKYKTIFIILLISIISLNINCQVSWTVENCPFSEPLKPASDYVFATTLRDDIEEALKIPKTPGFCKKENPSFPLDSGTMCGNKIGKDLGWKLDFKFQEWEPTHYKFEVGGDFGRGMCMFVNGEVYNTMQRNVWWAYDWNNSAVLRLSFNFEPGTHQILFYGGEDCCEGQQSMRFDRNGTGWKLFTQENVLDIMPFNCTFPCEKCSIEPTDCYTCDGANRNLENGCACNDGYYQDTDNICKKCFANCALCDSGTTCNKGVDGYYPANDKKSVILCPNKFKICSSATIGVVCQGTNRSSVIPNCDCNNSYYDDGTNANCVKCPLKYAKCQSPILGIQCQGSNRSSITPNCPCNKGFYDEGANPQNCTKCESNCTECTSGTVCTECSDSYYLHNQSCSKCPLKFSKCSNFTTAIQCANGTGRSLVTPNCLCNDGYYEGSSDSKNCISCQSPCKNCENNNDCLSCISSYYLVGKSCIKCPLKFAECSDITTGTKCQTGVGRSNITPNCQCEHGYYEGTTNSKDCIICKSPCKNCENDNDCLSCIDGYYLSGKKCLKCPLKFAKCSSSTVGTECAVGTGRGSTIPNCECNNGYYENTQNSENCLECQFPCISCSSPTSCTSCSVRDFINPIPKCTCQDGYYEKSDKQCAKCSHPCNKCIDNSNKCTECVSTINRLNYPSCLCNDGFFDNGTDMDCKACQHPCTKCTGLEINQCTECIVRENANASPNCQCKDGYYEDSDKKCVKCPNKFAKCSSASVGTECAVGLGRKSTTPNCECNLTYFDNGQVDCVACNFPCVNCSSPTICDSCEVRTNIQDTPSCHCLDGYYEKSDDKSCNICSHPCQKCEGSSTQCTQCVSQVNRQNYPSCLCLDGYFDNNIDMGCQECQHPCTKCIGIAVGQCTECVVRANANVSPNCHCKDGYYEDSDQKCVKCPKQCSKCSDENTCTECAEGTGRSGVKPTCGCESGYFDNGSSSADCIQCIHPCQSCSDLQTCDTCISRQFINSNPNCHCQAGYFEDSSSLQCVQCQHPCSSCSNSKLNCDECIPGDNRFDKPNCKCKDGFYENSKKECVPCQYPCLNCLSDIICIDCQNLENRVLPPNDNSECDCKDGYFDNGSICEECDYKCELCFETSDNCKSCSEITRHGAQCKCIDGFFDKGVPECEACDYKCKTCTQQNTNCIVCSEINRDINNSCQCKLGYYEDKNQMVCKECQFPCQYCSSQFKCDSCHETGDIIQDSLRTTPGCSCQNGYYQNTETKLCEKCHSRCLQCSGQAKNCMECKITEGRDYTLPICGCKQQGYFPVFTQNYLGEEQEICQKCKKECKTCNNADKCLTCNNKHNLPPYCEQFVQEELGVMSFSVNINGQNVVTTEICQTQCLECEDSIDNCTICRPGLYREMLLPQCGCKKGYYSDTKSNSNDCQVCQKNCQKCESQEICQECVPGKNMVVNKQTGQCVCSQGFTDSSKGCVKCYYYQHNCVQKCPANMIQDEEKYICISINIDKEQSSQTKILLQVGGSIVIFMILGKLIFLKRLVKGLKKMDQNINQSNSCDSSPNKITYQDSQRISINKHDTQDINI